MMIDKPSSTKPTIHLLKDVMAPRWISICSSKKGRKSTLTEVTYEEDVAVKRLFDPLVERTEVGIVAANRSVYN